MYSCCSLSNIRCRRNSPRSSLMPRSCTHRQRAIYRLCFHPGLRPLPDRPPSVGNERQLAMSTILLTAEESGMYRCALCKASIHARTLQMHAVVTKRMHH
eukprot:GHUV01039731.1.p2 GENE.GHUV01039731.1~~GHUV01039731.1.p2  ORF type:complete len:100 (+),score=10.74 GHUV01039731.1:403-702(+)